MPNLNSIPLKTKKLYRFQSGCHGNKYPKQPGMWLMRTVPTNLCAKCGLDTNEAKELLTYHRDCHGNLITIEPRNVTDAYHPKKPPYQISTVNSI